MSNGRDEPVPLVRQIAAVRRQMAHLDRVYDRLTAIDLLAAGDVLREVYEMQAVLATLQRLYTQQNPEIGFDL